MSGKNYLLVIYSLILFSAFVLDGCRPGTSKTVRVREKLNLGWRFNNHDVENAQDFSFDDSGWRQLTLPHDWAIEGPFSKNVYFQGGFLPYPGVGWYRKTFEISADGKNVLLEFDGVMKDAKVWLNNEYVGGWAYGYSSFAMDITRYLKHGQKNVLAVRVENVDYSSRWYPGAGIYRNVWLMITDPVHVAHWGTYVTTPAVSDDKATVLVETQIENNSVEIQNIELESFIIDAADREVARFKESMQAPVGNQTKREHRLQIDNPHRWDIETPYLYQVISLIKVDGKIVDEYSTPFGIRTFRFDATKGFFLNGRQLKLNGVNIHHDLGPLGTAVSSRATERQLEILKQMGVNAIRTAHNPPSPQQLDLCDKMGILVMDEAFDEWRKAKHNVQNSYSLLFDEWADRDMRTLIRRDRNHPSVILWSTGNEIPELGTPDGKKSAKMLADICREMDPTRPVSSGIHLSIPLDRELMDIFDVPGFNYWHEKLEEIHQTFPDKPILVTEASAVLSSRGEYQFPVKRIYSGFHDASLQISSYDMINTGFGTLPDTEFELQDNFEWLAGQFVWSGFDYHGEPDPYENMWPAHSSYFGIVDMCGFSKDRFYLYQSQWTEKAMIHVLPHWNWPDREGLITPVFIYTNCDRAELLVNGKSLGVKKKNKGEYRLKWDNVVYYPGEIKAIGYDQLGKVCCVKSIKTAGSPYKINLLADRDRISADGEDLAFITIRVLDRNGNFCPMAENLINFHVEGSGSIAAVGNGNPVSLESYQANQRMTFNGLCLLIVRSTEEKGIINITASSDNLFEDKIKIETR